MQRAGRVTAAIAVILLVGWADYATGPDIGLSLLYAAAVGALAWYGGAPEAIVSAIIAAGCWFAADVPWHPRAYLMIAVWNGFTRVVLFCAVAILTNKVRTGRDALVAMNEHMLDALRREASLARTDEITGLPNSRAFLESLAREASRAARERSTLCVLYLDIDLFKLVNDVYGHDAGDAVLRRTAEAIGTAIREGDVVARIGGDEFAVLLWHVSLDEAQQVVDRIARHFEPIARDYPMAYLGISAGIGWFEVPPADPEEVMRAADRAMYEAKQSRRHTGT